MAAGVASAIHAVWTASVGLAGLRLLDENPLSGLDLGTYAVLEQLKLAERRADAEGGRTVDGTWTLRTWTTGTDQSSSRGKAEAAADLIRTAFDGQAQALVVTGHTCLDVTEESEHIGLDDVRATPGRVVHEVVFTFVAHLYRIGA